MTTLYSPSGEKYETDSKVEVNRLVRGYGYTTEKPKGSDKPKADSAPKS